jgi:hypothetical protein
MEAKMSGRLKVAVLCYLRTLPFLIIFGLIYLFLPEFMPYHAVAVGLPVTTQVKEKAKPAPAKEKLIIVDFSKEEDVPDGRAFKDWMAKAGWAPEFGSPEYFSIRDGALHMVSKPGPVFRNRFWLALRDRDKLKMGMENKILLRIAGGQEFHVDPKKLPLLRFKMTPLVLPGKGADLRDSAKNDSAFYLLVSFDTERHNYEGMKMPETVAYVWANLRWAEPVGKDPDYAEFMRYVPIGWGKKQVGTAHEIMRNVKKDFLLAFPERKGKPVPDIIKIGLLIDSNTVDSVAESRLEWVRFESAP